MPEESFRAFTATIDGDQVRREITTLTSDDLAADGVLVAVECSTVNFKDGRATIPRGGVARISPLVPGIDLAGRVAESGVDGFPEGTPVLAHGYEIGAARHGGYAEYARVPAEWLVPMPDALDARRAMGVGTAGYTAAQSVLALERWGLRPDDGPVIVTGATGGVGSFAVGMLARRGYEVVASTGKPDATEYLHGIGAASVIERAELEAPGGKALESRRWAAGIDSVGSVTLANMLSRIRDGGAVAATGLVAGIDLPTTVMPFVVRGIALIGINSVETPIDERRAIWQTLASELLPDAFDDMIHDHDLGELEAQLDAVLAGRLVGRVVIRV
jgi:acrylyl-CoA reductase (NADPH)